MTKQGMSAWWAKRGDAWSAIGTAERALLEARLIPGAFDESVEQRVRDALGCLTAAREMLVIASERVHTLADKLPKPVAPLPGGERGEGGRG